MLGEGLIRVADIIYVMYTYTTDFIKLGLILVGIFNMPLIKRKSNYILLSVLQIGILIMGGYFYRFIPDMIVLFNSALVSVLICFIIEGKFYKKIAISVLSYLSISFLDATLVAILTVLQCYSDTPVEHILTNVVNIVFIGFVVVIKKRKYTSFKINFSKKIYAMFFTGSGTGVLIITALLIESNNTITNTARRFVLIITIILVAFYCYVCLKFSSISDSVDIYKELSQINQSIIESQQQYYTLVNEKQQEIRSLRHEMKNHLACINSLYHLNKIQEMEDYMGELIHLSTKTAELIDTGSDIVNAILNDVQSKYANENICLRVDGAFPIDLKIPQLDLSVIFANLVSNAIEAIQRMERKKDIVNYIDIRITSYKSDLYIDIKNPCENNLQIINGILITSKKDKSRHGFGVNNIIQKVEKYKGSYSFKQINNEFIVELFLENLSQD